MNKQNKKATTHLPESKGEPRQHERRNVGSLRLLLTAHDAWMGQFLGSILIRCCHCDRCAKVRYHDSSGQPPNGQLRYVCPLCGKNWDSCRGSKDRGSRPHLDL